MSKGYKSKRRNSCERQRKRIVLVVTEGNNKTETSYLKGFKNNNTKVVFSGGNYTDPENMMEVLIKEYRRLGLNVTDGDAGFCIVDADVSDKQEKAIKKADRMAANTGCSVIVSNPSVEVWFLCHFAYSTKQFKDAREVIDRLKDYYPEYQKNSDYLYEYLADKINIARRNAINLEEFCYKNGYISHTKGYLPSTEMYKVIDIINYKKKEDE